MKATAGLKATLLLAVVFAAGVALGIAYERRQPAQASAATDSHDTLGYLVSELRLDPAQERAVSEILKKHQAEIDSTWHSIQPHVRSALEATSSEIIAVLRPDQAAKYQQMTDRRHHARPH